MLAHNQEARLLGAIDSLTRNHLGFLLWYHWFSWVGLHVEIMCSLSGLSPIGFSQIVSFISIPRNTYVD